MPGLTGGWVDRGWRTVPVIDVILCTRTGSPMRAIVVGIITPEEERLLRRFADRVIVLVSEEAARERRAELEDLLRLDTYLDLALLPGHMSPDEFIAWRGGREAFERHVIGAPALLDYLADVRVARSEPVGPLLAKIGDEIRRRVETKRTAERLGISLDPPPRST